jgi:hypothetical protein
MKENIDNAFGGLGIGGVAMNKGWNMVKHMSILTIPFTDVALSILFTDLIKKRTNTSINKFCWYSFHDNYKFSKESGLYNKEQYDLFPSEMARRNEHIEVLYKIGNGAGSPFCSWNNDIRVGFLEFEDNYGYFIQCK